MKKFSPWSVVFTLCAIALAGTAIAGTATTTGLETLYTEVSGWLTGAPGKIMAIGFIILGIWQARQGSFLWFFGGLLMAIVLTVVPGIVDARFTALF